MLLPSGSESETQPSDQGIIRSVEIFIFEEQLHRALKMLKTTKANAYETLNKFNVENAIIRILIP